MGKAHSTTWNVVCLIGSSIDLLGMMVNSCGMTIVDQVDKRIWHWVQGYLLLNSDSGNTKYILLVRDNENNKSAVWYSKNTLQVSDKWEDFTFIVQFKDGFQMNI